MLRCHEAHGSIRLSGLGLGFRDPTYPTFLMSDPEIRRHLTLKRNAPRGPQAQP